MWFSETPILTDHVILSYCACAVPISLTKWLLLPFTAHTINLEAPNLVLRMDI